MRVVVIGSSAAGLSFAEAFRKGNGTADITIIGKEKVAPYFRPFLSHMILSENVEERFFLKPENYYEQERIRLCLDSEVVGIDRVEKSVSLKNGEKIAYDKLVLAVGSYNFVPPIPGVDKKGVFDLKYVDDIHCINEYCVQKERITVVGGGLLGIEAAWAFLHAGKKVTILEFAPRLMARQLCEEASQMVKEELEKAGITILLGKSTKEIRGQEAVQEIELESGEVIPTDLLFFSIGVRPNVEIAKHARLEVDRGIVVNANMQTSDEDIYAVGDCSQLGMMVPGIWPMAMQMGKIAAGHLLGQPVAMKMSPPIAILKALDIGVYSAGDITKAEDVLSIREGNDLKYFTFEQGKLTGVNLIGNTKLSSKIPKLLAQGASKAEVENIVKEI